MKAALRAIDDLLRGRLTSKEDLAAGRIEVPVLTLVVSGLVLGALYGIFMGIYATLRPDNPSFAQLLATSLKVPLLFLLTLLVTYPSLYVVSALFDSRLRHAATLRLLLMAMCANLALLASFGPVTAFFTFCTDSYPFMIVLNVVFFGVAGLAGLAFLRRALESVFEPEQRVPEPTPVPVTIAGPKWEAEEEQDSAQPTVRLVPPPAMKVRPPAPSALRVFRFWIVIYGVVGAQMGWVLRPFVGSPYLPFELFRAERESNFFAAFLRGLQQLFN